MKKLLPLDNVKKLGVIYRVEAGCLGPNGLNYIADFCDFAQAKLQASDSGFIIWTIVHREDKTLPEIEYGLFGKTISTDKTDKYLSVFGKNIDDFESDISDHLATLIRQFMSNQ
jgi:hypothetical protein